MKRVLIAPLDWGLGHATRCIPVVEKLLDRKCEVFFAGSGDSLKLLKEEFPSCNYFILPAYNPVYPTRGESMVWKMAVQIPKFFKTIRDEHEAVEKIVLQKSIDLVISDNRYGCWSKHVPCVFITHQSNILMPKRFGWLQGMVRRINERYMKKFSRCWVPDSDERHTLAGELIAFGKKTSSLNVNYIGPLSRFRPGGSVKKEFDITAVFSGPEPQRTLLEEKVLPQLKASGLRYFVVRGVLSSQRSLVKDNQADYLTARDLQKVIESSDVILARSGYSTVMDMTALGKKVIFIPTPGQTEQEYLAEQLMKSGIAFFMKQDRFDLAVAIESGKMFSGFPVMHNDYRALDEALAIVLKSL